MKKLWVTLFAVCVTLSAADKYPSTIRVLVVDGLSEISVEVTGSYQITNPIDGEYVGRGLFGKRFPLKVMEGGLSWGERYMGIYQITITPEHRHSTFLIDGTPYRGTLHCYNIEGRLSIVNEVSIEDYCRALMVEAIDRDFEPEVLSAMAIAARTHAYYDVARRHGAYWHVKAEDVGYRGDISSRYANAVRKAFKETDRMVLELPEMGHAAFPATWTADCAGKTASYHRLYRGESVSPMQGVAAPFAERHRHESFWKTVVAKDWLARALDVDKVASVSPHIDAESDKVCALLVETGFGTREFDFPTWQRLVGNDRIRSSDFTVQMDGDEVIFSGYGEGHGVGICLYSAERMASRGDKASDILATFYPEASIQLAAIERTGARKPLARRYPVRFRNRIG